MITGSIAYLLANRLRVVQVFVIMIKTKYNICDYLG